jgi:hypothetical protein
MVPRTCTCGCTIVQVLLRQCTACTGTSRMIQGYKRSAIGCMWFSESGYIPLYSHEQENLIQDSQSYGLRRRSECGYQICILHSLCTCASCLRLQLREKKVKKKKTYYMSPRANYTERATAACRRS